jgi:hypothetical protein
MEFRKLFLEGKSFKAEEQINDEDNAAEHFQVEYSEIERDDQ